jgi:hypothetical protein
VFIDENLGKINYFTGNSKYFNDGINIGFKLNPIESGMRRVG